MLSTEVNVSELDTGVRFSVGLGDLLVAFICGAKQTKSKYRFGASIIEKPSLSASKFFVSFFNASSGNLMMWVINELCKAM